MANITEGLLRTQRLLESAVDERPDMLLYRLMLANVHKLQLNLTEAREAYAAARDHDIRGNFAVSLRDEALRQQAIFEVANLELIRAEAAETPTEREAILELADAAVNELEAVIDQDPRVLMLRGKLGLLRNQTTAAMQYLDRASDLYQDRDIEALLLSARARQAEKQWGSAASRLEQVLAIVKASPRQDIQGTIRMQLAEMLIRSRKYPESREEIDFILDSEPKNPVAVRLLAEWYSTQERYTEAIEVLEDSGLSETNPGRGPQARRALSIQRRGRPGACPAAQPVREEPQRRRDPPAAAGPDRRQPGKDRVDPACRGGRRECAGDQPAPAAGLRR